MNVIIKKYKELVDVLPEDKYFGVNDGEISFQARTLEEAREIRGRFGAVKWEKRWSGGQCQWWEWHTDVDGVHIKIYAIREKPQQCEAVYEKRIVKVKVPTQWVEKEEEQEVLVGYNCTEVKEIRG